MCSTRAYSSPIDARTPSSSRSSRAGAARFARFQIHAEEGTAIEGNDDHSAHRNGLRGIAVLAQLERPQLHAGRAIEPHQLAAAAAHHPAALDDNVIRPGERVRPGGL